MFIHLKSEVRRFRLLSYSSNLYHRYRTFVLDPKCPSVIQLKVGSTVNLVSRLDEWDQQCGSEMHTTRGWWPGPNGSLLKGSIKAGPPGPLCRRVERLVHIELTDLVVHTPYLSNPNFPEVENSDTPTSSIGSLTPKKGSTPEKKPTPKEESTPKEGSTPKKKPTPKEGSTPKERSTPKKRPTPKKRSTPKKFVKKYCANCE
jgi:hypothetical protein